MSKEVVQRKIVFSMIKFSLQTTTMMMVDLLTTMNSKNLKMPSIDFPSAMQITTTLI